MKIADTKDIRALNRLIILKTIQKDTPISRADIATLTNLNKGTVSTIVKELIDLHLVKETSTGDSTGGRKPIMLTPIYSNGYAISLDINITHINMMVTDLNTQIISQHQLPIEGTDFDHNFKRLCTFLKDVMSTLEPKPFGVVGIGVAVRGIVDLNHVIRYIHVLNWINIDLKNLLETEFGIPVHIENEGNFSALAESLHYPHIKDLAVLTIDDVVSAGALSNRQLVHGFRGYANSFAHHIINFEGNLCICGQRGCLEAYISHRALLKAVNQTLSVPDIDTFITLAKEKHPVVTEVLQDFVVHVAAGLTNLIYILDCERIIINSKILTAIPELLNAIQECLILPITKVQSMTISQIGSLAPLLGAAKLACDTFFRDILIF